MRARIRHTRTFSVGQHTFTLDRMRYDMLDEATNKRTLHAHAFGRDGGITNILYLFGTLTEALVAITNSYSAAEKTAAGVMAYCEGFDMQGNPQTLLITDHAAVLPDLSGLKIEINGTNSADDWDGIWQYVDSPASSVLQEIESVLGNYMGSGQSLDGFTAARIVKGPEELLIMGRAPSIIAAIADESEAVRQAGDFALDVFFSVLVGDRGMKNRGEDVYLDVMGYAGSVRSILGDENITLNGVTVETVILSVEGPGLIAGEGEPYLASKVNGVCKFPVLNSDA